MEKAIAQGRLLDPEGESAWALYEKLRQSSADPGEKEQARTKLAAALESAGQGSIKAYMQARDPAPGGSISSPESGFTANEFHQAGRLFSRAMELRPADGRLRAKQRFCEGRALVAEGRFQQAWPLLQESVGLDGTAAYVYNTLGLVHFSRRTWSEAENSFLHAEQLAPKWVLPRHNLGLTYLEMGRFEDAERAWVLATLAAEKRAFTHLNLGVLYLKMGRQREAEREIRHALSLDPEGAATNHNLGLMYQMQNQLGEAEKYYRKAILADPESVPSRVNLAILYRTQGHPDQAEQQLRLALKSDPNNQTARRALDELLKEKKKTAKR